METEREVIAALAVALDRTAPDWAGAIDLSTLNLTLPWQCIAGQMKAKGIEVRDEEPGWKGWSGPIMPAVKLVIEWNDLPEQFVSADDLLDLFSNDIRYRVDWIEEIEQRTTVTA